MTNAEKAKIPAASVFGAVNLRIVAKLRLPCTHLLPRSAVEKVSRRRSGRLSLRLDHCRPSHPGQDPKVVGQNRPGDRELAMGKPFAPQAPA